MKKLLLLFILIGSFVNAQKTLVDSLFSKYKPYIEDFGKFDSTIPELELKRNNLNQSLGLIILETDPTKRKKLISQNISKSFQNKLFKMSTKEIEDFRNDYDGVIKAKIAQKCSNIELKHLELNVESMKKSQINFLIDNGYNLADFAKLSEIERNKILKNWKIKQ